MRTIHIDQPIGNQPGELSAKWLRAQLPTDGSDIVLEVHCEGGSVLEGLAMLDVLAAYRGKVRAVVSSMALSMGSVLLCGASEVEVTQNAYCMLHDPHVPEEDISPSERKLLGSLTDRMVQIYSKRIKKPASVIRSMMASETFLNASEAVNVGLADRVVDASRLQISARAIPSRIVARIQTARGPIGTTATARWRAAVLACGSVSAANRQNPALRLAMIAEANRR